MKSRTMNNSNQIAGRSKNPMAIVAAFAAVFVWLSAPLVHKVQAQSTLVKELTASDGVENARFGW